MTDYVAKNKEAWDESARLHKSSDRWAELKKGFATDGYVTFDDTARTLLEKINLNGKTVAQLGCNNGREVLSMLNMGAKSATGFDQSKEFLAQARELLTISGKDASFIEANILELPSEFDEKFDVVLITIGVLNWLPDLQQLFRSVKQILKRNGTLFIYETHPILDVFDPTSSDPFTAQYSYFRAEPFQEDEAITYTGGPQKSETPSYWFFHPLGEILTQLLESGMTLEHFKEYPHSNREEIYDKYAQRDAKLPMCFTLISNS